MKLLKIIQFKDLSPEETNKFQVREAARAVVFDEDKNIALLYVGKYKSHKLPGGGVEKGESIMETLRRECLEEIGCEIKAEHELGEIIEYRDKWSLKQYSYCYLAELSGKKGSPNFTPEELAKGFMIKWLPLTEAIKLLASDKPVDYEGSFIKTRDSLFLKEASDSIS